MHSLETIDRIASAIYGAVYKNSGGFEDASDTAKAEARADARTILSAHLCGQTTLEAAMRLNTWHWVDRKKPHKTWYEAPEALRTILLKKAGAGMSAARGGLK